MTRRTLLFRSLRFHLRAHLGVVLGAAVGSAALVGALIVGDSVRGSLREMALTRLGKIQLALIGSDRLFRDALASDWQSKLNAPTAPALMLRASAANEEGSSRANQVQLVGVDERFWSLAQVTPKLAAQTNGALINTTLASHLRLKVGDTILLRADKPSLLSRDAPITPQQDYAAALRLPVAGILKDVEFGRFSLQANQLPPFNAFVPLALLQARAETVGRANLIFVGPSDTPLDLSATQKALWNSWNLQDAQLELRTLTNATGLELRSERIFLDPSVVDAARAGDKEAQPLLTYFVNELRVGDKTTPYSMVTGLGAPIVPAEMKDDEILINSWLAEDLGAKAGDEMKLTYYVVGTGQRLNIAESKFKVRGVVPLEGAAADPQLMPEFPGLAEAESTHSWDAGFPIDNTKIRDKDEAYWKAYRGTPKAFVTLPAAQKSWSSRFGNITAVRFSEPPEKLKELSDAVGRALDPSSVGLNIVPVRTQALAAANQSMDFGQLFLGFSFFLIVAALVLMALLFEFGLEQRAAETGTLLALGFRPKQVRWLLLTEGTTLAFVGGLLGLAGGGGYAKAMVYGLSTIWSDAIGGSSLQYHAQPVTFVIGLFSSVIVCALTIAWVLRKQARQPARELLAGTSVELLSPPRKPGRKSAITGVVALIIALAICLATMKSGASAPAFFGAGGLLLIAGLAFASAVLQQRAKVEAALSLVSMGWRNAKRRRRRSLATIILLACGSFLVAAIGANKLDAGREASKRSSGTGGFALVGQSTLPVVHDLNSPAGQEFFGLDTNDLPGVAVVQFRVRDGDDASCLNLNRAQNPRLLGVRPEQLQERGAFTFAKTASGVTDPWLALNQTFPDGAVPAIGDWASIQYALGKKIGDTLTYEDERGRPFLVRLVGGLANSIMQGNLIIAEPQFVEKFPGQAGYRMFLIDVPSNQANATAATLSRALQDVGLELTPATQRLAAFNAVQNTYLNTFQVLGGLGLLLGSAGLGVVVLRNVLERRAELALLQAVGFRKRRLRWLVLSEHTGLLLTGLAVGISAALLAVLPALLAPGAQVHVLALAATLAGVLISGLIWTLAATSLALRGELLPALRDE